MRASTPYPRAQDHRRVPTTGAPHGRAFSIFLCRPVLAVLLSCLQHTLAPLLVKREVRAYDRNHSGRGALSGPGDWRPLLGHRTFVSYQLPSRSTVARSLSYHTVRTGGATVVPPAHARAAGDRNARCACARHRSGCDALSGPGGYRPPLELRMPDAHQIPPHRTVARATSCRDVSYWRCTCRATSARSHRSS